MGTVIGVLFLIGFVGFLVYAYWPREYQGDIWQVRQPEEAEEARVLGFMAGLLGGSIEHAILARYALDRFEKQHGRKATMHDMAVVVSLVRFY